MERIIDKAIVFSCCLMAAAVAMAQTMPGNTPNASFALVAMTLLAIVSTALCETARGAARYLAPLAYCAATCFVPAGTFFLPLAAYDFMRCIHEASPVRFLIASAAFALVASTVREPHGALALFALVCATATGIVLSARTNKLIARWRIGHRTRDTLRARALALQAENASLAEELAETEAEREAQLARSAGIEAVGGRDGEDGVKGDGARNPPLRPAAFAHLTEREYEVAVLVSQGLDNREIAACAYMSEGTVRNHISSILAKMHLKNRTQIAVAYYTSQ